MEVLAAFVAQSGYQGRKYRGGTRTDDNLAAALRDYEAFYQSKTLTTSKREKALVAGIYSVLDGVATAKFNAHLRESDKELTAFEWTELKQLCVTLFHRPGVCEASNAVSRFRFTGVPAKFLTEAYTLHTLLSEKMHKKSAEFKTPSKPPTPTVVPITPATFTTRMVDELSAIVNGNGNQTAKKLAALFDAAITGPPSAIPPSIPSTAPTGSTAPTDTRQKQHEMIGVLLEKIEDHGSLAAFKVRIMDEMHFRADSFTYVSCLQACQAVAAAQPTTSNDDEPATKKRRTDQSSLLTTTTDTSSYSSVTSDDTTSSSTGLPDAQVQAIADKVAASMRETIKADTEDMKAQIAQRLNAYALTSESLLAASTPRKCYRCNRTDHLAVDCTERAGSAPTNRSNRPPNPHIKCWKCGATGHIERHCPDGIRPPPSNGRPPRHADRGVTCEHCNRYHTSPPDLCRRGIPCQVCQQPHDTWKCPRLFQRWKIPDSVCAQYITGFSCEIPESANHVHDATRRDMFRQFHYRRHNGMSRMKYKLNACHLCDEPSHTAASCTLQVFQ